MVDNVDEVKLFIFETISLFIFLSVFLSHTGIVVLHSNDLLFWLGLFYFPVDFHIIVLLLFSVYSFRFLINENVGRLLSIWLPKIQQVPTYLRGGTNDDILLKIITPLMYFCFKNLVIFRKIENLER